MKRIAILISGNGSNMQALLQADLPCDIVSVISNRADAKGLQIAAQHDIPTTVISHHDFDSREAFDQALGDHLQSLAVDYIILAGFMRILSDSFVDRFAGRLLNIHPSLLPAYPGLNTHQKALQDGVKIHGCTVHFVTPRLDHGPIIIQAAVPVLPEDTAETLAARVLAQEHRVYPQAVRWLCLDKIRLSRDGHVKTVHQPQPDFALVSPGLI